MDGRIFKLRTDLQERLDQQWSVEKMASRAGLSLSHFPTLFRTAIGTTPGRYLKDLRLERARELLELTFFQVKEIGIRVGIPMRVSSRVNLRSNIP